MDNFTVIADTDPLVYTAAKYHAAQVGNVTYSTVQEALGAAKAEPIKLLNDTQEDIVIEGEALLDLNGKTLSGSISGTGSLQVIDSENNDYQGYGCLTANIDNGISVNKVSSYDGRTYVCIGRAGNYSFHRLYINLTNGVFRPDYYANRVAAPGVYFKYALAGDEILTSEITQHGIAVIAGGDNSLQESDILGMDALSDYSACSAAVEKMTPAALYTGNGVMVYGIMKQTNTAIVNRINSETALWGRAYVQLADGTQIFSDNCMGGTLRSFIEGADDLWDEQKLSSEQQQALAQMYQIV